MNMWTQLFVARWHDRHDLYTNDDDEQLMEDIRSALVEQFGPATEIYLPVIGFFEVVNWQGKRRTVQEEQEREHAARQAQQLRLYHEEILRKQELRKQELRELDRNPVKREPVPPREWSARDRWSEET